MEPILQRMNELGGIVSSGSHRCTDNVAQLPYLQNVARNVHLDHCRFEVRCGIRVQDNSNFATVDVVVEINNSETAVIAKEGESAIEVDSRQLVAMSQIGCVIKEGDITERQASRAHPPQCAVRIDDGRFEIATRPFNHDVVVAQIGAICTCLQDRRMVVSAWIIKTGRCDSGASLLGRTVQKAISESDDIRISSVKSVNWQNNLWRVFKPPAHEVVIGISA